MICVCVSVCVCNVIDCCDAIICALPFSILLFFDYVNYCLNQFLVVFLDEIIRWFWPRDASTSIMSIWMDGIPIFFFRHTFFPVCGDEAQWWLPWNSFVCAIILTALSAVCAEYFRSIVFSIHSQNIKNRLDRTQLASSTSILGCPPLHMCDICRSVLVWKIREKTR